MVKENLKPIIENKKLFETVYEIKNETPSFEEFMKNYENDGNLNYDDLSSSDVGISKGYGPTNEGANTQKWCGKCNSYKDVAVNCAYCSTCGTAFGTVSTTTTIDKQIKEGMESVRKHGGSFTYAVERRTGADGSYSEKESATWDKK